MKVPYCWLREYCDPGLPAEELLSLIALRTTEVERISLVGPPAAEDFVVGKVLSVQPHPDADRLSVCEVDTGDGTRTIVCGAPNVAAGQTVPVALPGAMMPGGEKLGKAKLRGVESDGMILSEAELQIGEDAAGIVVLDDGAAPGSALRTSCRSPSRCWSSRCTPTGSTASASTGSPARSTRSPARRSPSRPGRTTPRPGERARSPTTPR